MKRRLGLAGTLCALLVGMGSAQAGLLQPQTIDAGTGADAVDVGAAFGNRQAWAGLEQASGGVTRLYVAHAQDGVFAGAQTADRGNRITSAALTGNANGDAVVVFTEPVGGVSTLFGRRLSGGQIGPMLQI